eukprot:scaffold470_cov98-Cylindrotheca_fusiformis.AAC.2
MAKSKSSTQPDVEGGMSTPQKGKQSARNVSPAKTEPMSPMNHTITIEQRDAPRGMFGMTRPKTFFMCGVYIVLIGGLVYFILTWLQIPGLKEEIDRLEGQVDRLAVENDRYSDLNDDLKVTAKELDDTVSDLNVTVTGLNASVQELSGQVDDLRKVNSDLEAISELLDTAADDAADVYNQITTYLEEQLVSNTDSALSAIESRMRARLTNWGCNFGPRFGAEEFGQNFSVEIPAASWTEVSDYVSERVLDAMCLDSDDFLRYLQKTYSPWTPNNLIQAVSVYTETALDFYFPEENEVGLTPDDWANANYECKNLSTKYRMYEDGRYPSPVYTSALVCEVHHVGNMRKKASTSVAQHVRSAAQTVSIAATQPAFKIIPRGTQRGRPKLTFLPSPNAMKG